MNIFKDKGNESGLSLVEVLVSIVLLSIVLTSFLTLFIQSAKTGKASEEIIDNTYLAQQEMERIYNVSLETSYTNRVSKIEGLGYSITTSANKLITFGRVDVKSGAYIKLKLKNESAYIEITNIVIEVYESEGGPLRAKMEDILEWRAE